MDPSVKHWDDIILGGSYHQIATFVQLYVSYLDDTHNLVMQVADAGIQTLTDMITEREFIR